MKRNAFIVSNLLVILLFSGCATIKGSTLEDKRQYILEMRDAAIKELYSIRPEAEIQIDGSAGYAVFSNINSHLFLISMTNGYGVLTDNMTDEKTYLKALGAGGGPGIGIKDFRAIIIFRNKDDMDRFVDQGWDFHGQFDAVAMSGEKGGSISSAKSLDSDIITYQLTEAGIGLQLTIQGTKFRKYDALNRQ